MSPEMLDESFDQLINLQVYLCGCTAGYAVNI
jgi:hypothetical protein